MFIRTKRGILINLAPVITIHKSADDDKYLALMTEKHFIRLKSLTGTADELLDVIAKSIQSGERILEIDAVIE